MTTHFNKQLYIRSNLLILMLSIILYSCKQKNKQIEQVWLTDKTLPNVEKLHLEKIDLPEDYVIGSRCYIYNDSILLVIKRDAPYPLTHMLTIFNMNTWNKIGQYFTRGQGPNEFLSLRGFLGCNRLDLCCYVTRNIVSCNIDSAIMLGEYYKPHIVTYEDEGLQDFRYLDNGTFLTSNMFYFDGCSKYKTDKSIPEFYVVNSKGEFLPTTKKINLEKLKCFPANVNGCGIAVNKKKNRVICCYHYQPYIKVFDLNMVPIRKINCPEPDDGEYTIEYNNMLFFNRNKGANHYFDQPYYNNDDIFIINNRNHGDKSYGGAFVEKEKETTEIWRLDWDGNVIGRYKTEGFELIYITYSKSSNNMYLWLNDNGENALYKAKLSFPPHVTQN